jgi:hypothetical protein
MNLQIFHPRDFLGFFVEFKKPVYSQLLGAIQIICDTFSALFRPPLELLQVILSTDQNYQNNLQKSCKCSKFKFLVD